MTDTEMKALRCGTDFHDAMTRLLEDHRPMQSGTFSLWVCQDCGVMALHLETAGTIFWYERTMATQTVDQGGVRPRCRCGKAKEHIHDADATRSDGSHIRLGLEVDGVVRGVALAAGGGVSHRATCAYCQTRFSCLCKYPGYRHMCPGCDSPAEDSKEGGKTFPFTGEPGKAAADGAAIGPRYPEDLTPAETGAGATDDF